MEKKRTNRKKRQTQGTHTSPEEGKEPKVKCVKVMQAESFPNGEKDKSLMKLYIGPIENERSFTIR